MAQLRHPPAVPTAVLSVKQGTLRFARRLLWEDLNLSLAAGEFLAILGPNGTGKTTLLRTILGLEALTEGTIEIQGRAPHQGNSQIGYIPQQKAFDRDLPIRGRDLVHFGFDGHRFGFVHHDKQAWHRVDEVIKEVGASAYANNPIGLLSGGEQQRLRIAQALLSKPSLLLCDEPLLSLDLKSQQAISDLINSYRIRFHTAVLFVTHDINPILNMVDRVLYLVGGKWVLGSPDEVLTSQSLSQVYGTAVDVLRVRDRIVIVNTPDDNEVNGQHHIDKHPVETGK